MGAAHNALWAFNARVAGADHGYCEIKRRTRQINLLSATVSLQVVIGLCKRKETAALKSKPPLQMGVSNCLLYDGFFLLPSCGSCSYLYLSSIEFASTSVIFPDLV